MISLNKRKLKKLVIQDTMKFDNGMLTLGSVRVHLTDTETI